MIEKLSRLLAVVVYITSFDITVRTSEVDILHRTHRMSHRLSIELASDTMMVESHDLTWLDITNIFSSKNFECACLAGNYIAITQLTDRKRMETILVTTRINTTTCHDEERKCAVNLIQGVLDGIDTWKCIVDSLFLDKVSKNLRIR